MSDLEHDLKTILERDAERSPLVTRAPSDLRSRVRRRQIASTAAGVAAALCLVAIITGVLVLLPRDHGRPADGVGGLERSNVLGVSIEHPTDWPLIRVASHPLSYEGGREIAPVFQLTNFDPDPNDSSDLSWICPFPSGGVPEDGVVLYVQEVLSDPSGSPADRWPVEPSNRAEPWWVSACSGQSAARFQVHGRTYEAFLTGEGANAFPSLIDAFRSMTFSVEAPEYADLRDAQQDLSIGNPAAWVLASGEQAGVPWSLLGIRVQGDVCLAAEVDGRTGDLACGGELGAPTQGIGKPVLFEARGASLAFGLASPNVVSVETIDRVAFGNEPGDVGALPEGWGTDASRAYVLPGPPDAVAVRAFDAAGAPAGSWGFGDHRTMATGTWRAPGAQPVDWEIRLWRYPHGLLCMQALAIGGPSFCNDDVELSGGAPDPFVATSIVTTDSDAGTSVFGSGAFFEPVTNVRIELDDGRTIRAQVHPPPPDFRELGAAYTFAFDGRAEGRIVGLDRNGDEVAFQRFVLP